jgi:tripartite-type tricarboxylate transporter receptor subunit TctC
VHIAFTSGGLAIGSTVAGHTPISFTSPATAVPQVKEGKLRALAVTSKTRSQALPDVVVPARTPKEIITLLHREIVKMIALPDMKERWATLGLEPVGNTPDECAAQFRTELAKWAKVIREAGHQGAVRRIRCSGFSGTAISTPTRSFSRT